MSITKLAVAELGSTHRDQALAALGHAQRNPVLSATESFLAAQVHALLAIEEQLGELVAALRGRVV